MALLYDEHHFARTLTDSGTRGVLVLVVNRTEGKDGATLYAIREITSHGGLRSWQGTARSITQCLDNDERKIVEKCARLYDAAGKPRPNIDNHPDYGSIYGFSEPA